jgi:hypothetical protein
MDVALAALRQRIARWTDKEGLLVTAIPGVSLARRDAPTQPTSSLYEPSICVIAQGVKRVLLGDDTYVFDAHHFLITSVDLPTVVQILHASREQPYLSLLVQLDPREMAQLMADSHLPPPQAQPASRGMATGAVTVPLLSACQRLLDLLAAPQDIPILAPLIQREILYRLGVVDDEGGSADRHSRADSSGAAPRTGTLPLPRPRVDVSGLAGCPRTAVESWGRNTVQTLCKEHTPAAACLCHEARAEGRRHRLGIIGAPTGCKCSPGEEESRA